MVRRELVLGCARRITRWILQKEDDKRRASLVIDGENRREPAGAAAAAAGAGARLGRFEHARIELRRALARRDARPR